MQCTYRWTSDMLCSNIWNYILLTYNIQSYTIVNKTVNEKHIYELFKISIDIIGFENYEIWFCAL